MLNENIGRRKALQLFGLTAGTSVLPNALKGLEEPAAVKKASFTFCLNMATIRGHQLGFKKELETASAAGFGSVEIWIDSLQDFLNKGATIQDVKKLLDGLGLKVENCICFHQWIAGDNAIRKNALEKMKRDMDLFAEIGCKRMAATGSGADNSTGIDKQLAAERYRAVLELGQPLGIVPLLEMWGFMKNLSRASEVLYIAMESGHPSAKILLDVFHLYRGNTPLDTLHLMNPFANDILHINDYPPAPAYNVITDADRIYPGDGIAPLPKILKILQRNDQPLVISCELFNKTYYSQDAVTVAKTSLAKMKEVVGSL